MPVDKKRNETKIKGRGRPKKDSPVYSKRLYFATTEEVESKLKEKADKERRTVTETIRICLEDYFKIKR